MNATGRKGSSSIRTVFPLLLLVTAMVCVSATIFVNTSEDVEGAEYTDGNGIKYTLYDNDDGTKTATVALNHKSGAITIPKEVTYLDEQYTVTSIGINAFFNCSLTSVTFGADSALESIGSGAFGSCSLLAEITIPSSVTSIGGSAFGSCSGLTKVTFEGESKLESIGHYAFNGCSQLTEITIPSGVTSIGDRAFSGCSRLTSITIPAGVTSIGVDAFSDCSGLTKVTFEDESKLQYIGNFAFFSCSQLTEIIIPSGVTSIGDCAFSGCSQLTEITIPSGVTSIGARVFEGCIGLTSITIPSGVTSIGNYAFNGCSGLTKVTFGSDSKLTSIGACAFIGCSGLEEIAIPAGVTSIGNIAFNGCTSFKTVTISEIGEGSGNILGTYFNGTDWKIEGSPPITTLRIDTTDEISINAVNITEGNTLVITTLSENVTGADGKVIFNAKVVAGADRADDDREYKGTKGLWVAGTTDVKITVVASPAEGGVSGTIECSVGDVVEAIAKNKNGYSFIEWTDTNGDLLSSDPTYSFQAKENTELTAVFEIIMMDLSVRADPSHQGEVKGSGTYEYGTIVKITATPNKGYKFVAWSDGITDAERSVKLTTDTSLTAYFVEDDPNLCTITVIIKGNGNVYGMGTFAKGTVITLNASPDQGYSFQGWSHTPYSGQTIQLSVESDMVITATFSQNDTGIGGSNTTIDTTTVIIIVVVIVVIFGIIVAVSLIRGRGSV